MTGRVKPEWLGTLISFAGSLALYGISLAPTVQGFDSAELTMGAFDLGFVHPTGYPLYMLVGNLFSQLPVGTIGLRLNWMSAIFASVGVALLFKLLYAQIKKLWSALALTALFATIPAFWSQAVRAEVYALHIALITGTLYAWFQALQAKDGIDRKALWGGYLLLGLGLANHLTSVLLLFAGLVWGVFLGPKDPTSKKALRRDTLAGAGLALLIGAGFYLYFPWRTAIGPKIDYIQPYFGVDLGSLQGMIWMISGRAFSCLLAPGGAGSLFQELASLSGHLWSGMLGVGLVLAIIGWGALHRERPTWNRLLTVYFAANIVLHLAYQAIDKHVMFLPLYTVLCLWAGKGVIISARWLASLWQRPSPAQIQRWTGTALLCVVFLGAVLDWSSVSLRNERRAYRFVEEVLKTVPLETTIVSHWATASVFDYALMVDGRRPDVQSVNVDFYFLGVQEACRPVSENQLVDSGWIPWLADLSEQGRLCFIEPLHTLTEDYHWVNLEGACWALEPGPEPE